MKNLKFLFLFLFLFPFFSANAAVCYDCIKSGDSLKGIAKLGAKYVGEDGYYQFDDNTWDTSTASGQFDVSWYKHNDFLSGSELVGFSVDFCVNGKQPDFQIWSYYDNYVDFYYPLGTKEYLGNEEWTGSDCYRAYIRLKMNYYDNLSTSSDGIDFINYSFNSNVFAIRTHFGYGAILKFTDLVYLNTKDYNELLTEAKSIVSNQTIINQNIVTNEKLDDIYNSDLDESDKQLPDDSSINDYEDIEGEIVGKIDDVSFDNVSIGIDSQSSSWVWDTLTRLIQSHSAIFGMFIAILSIGIIKLALGR